MEAQRPALPQLNALLTLARELFQDDDMDSSPGLAVPGHTGLVALIVAWDHDLDGADQDAHARTMSSILGLTAAALGKIEARTSLEHLVRYQREHIATSAAEYAAELARRDLAATEMRMLSLTDVLTGLYNRRGIFVQAERVFKVARRKRARSAVIFADIDGLKRVNDELGHDTGDRLILDVALSAGLVKCDPLGDQTLADD